MEGDEDDLFYAALPLMSRADMRRAWKERPVYTFLATAGGVGMIPVAPGTWGSFVGLLICAALGFHFGRSRFWSACPVVDKFLAFFPPGIWRTLESARYQISGFSVEGAVLAPLLQVGYIFGFAVVILGIGLFVSGRVEPFCVSRDPGAIVIDEVVGQILSSLPVVFFWNPDVAVLLRDGDYRFVTALRPGLWIVSFLLFRLFDVWKPGPIRRLQALPGGWGIMADDVAAGIVAGALTLGIGMMWR